MEVCFGLCRRDVSDGFQQAAVVEPVDPFEGGEFHGGEASPGTAAADHLGFVEADDRLCQSIVIRVADTSNRRLDPEVRLAARRERTAPLITDMEPWLTYHRARVAAKSPLGEALKYIARYWDGLCLFLTDGRIEIDNNTVERTIRPIALNRKNALFAGHQAGAENWAVIASLIETCKLNAIDPQAYLAATLTAIVNGHKQSRIDELLPCHHDAKV